MSNPLDLTPDIELASRQMLAGLDVHPPEDAPADWGTKKATRIIKLSKYLEKLREAQSAIVGRELYG